MSRSIFRKPSLRKSFKARTTGRMKREIKRALIPGYGRKGMGLLTNPKRSLYNAAYHRTSIDTLRPLKGKYPASNRDNEERSSNASIPEYKKSPRPNNDTSKNQLITLKNKDTGVIKTVHSVHSWTTLIFGFFVPLFRKDIKYFFIFLFWQFLGIFTLGISTIVILIKGYLHYNEWYIDGLIEKGFQPINQLTILKPSADFQRGENMELDKVLKQLKSANVQDTFGTKREIKLLPEVLDDDEVIKYATSGFVQNSTILVVCTNKRVIFLNKHLLGRIDQSEIPLEMINGILYTKGLMSGKIIVVNGAQQTEIDQLSTQTAPIMAKAIKDAAKALKEKSNTPDPSNTTSADLANELRKLKGLVDDGIITQDDFDAKKKQLLGL